MKVLIPICFVAVCAVAIYLFLHHEKCEIEKEDENTYDPGPDNLKPVEKKRLRDNKGRFVKK